MVKSILGIGETLRRVQVLWDKMLQVGVWAFLIPIPAWCWFTFFQNKILFALIKVQFSTNWPRPSKKTFCISQLLKPAPFRIWYYLAVEVQWTNSMWRFCLHHALDTISIGRWQLISSTVNSFTCQLVNSIFQSHPFRVNDIAIPYLHQGGWASWNPYT